MRTSYKKLYWTEHSKIKMRQYSLSKQKILSILAKPERREKGIVEGTIAVMRTNKKFYNKNKTLFKKSRWPRLKKAPGEIWIMYEDVKIKSIPTRKIISTWRYPGISKPKEAIPIPEDIKKDLISGIIK